MKQEYFREENRAFLNNGETGEFNHKTAEDRLSGFQTFTSVSIAKMENCHIPKIPAYNYTLKRITDREHSKLVTGISLTGRDTMREISNFSSKRCLGHALALAKLFVLQVRALTQCNFNGCKIGDMPGYISEPYQAKHPAYLRDIDFSVVCRVWKRLISSSDSLAWTIVEMSVLIEKENNAFPHFLRIIPQVIRLSTIVLKVLTFLNNHHY
jgi:hypothetical protein